VLSYNEDLNVTNVLVDMILYVNVPVRLLLAVVTASIRSKYKVIFIKRSSAQQTKLTVSLMLQRYVYHSIVSFHLKTFSILCTLSTLQ